jgi:hypothetical protein
LKENGDFTIRDNNIFIPKNELEAREGPGEEGVGSAVQKEVVLPSPESYK